MKRIFAGLLALVLTVSLCACGGEPASSDPAPSTTTTATDSAATTTTTTTSESTTTTTEDAITTTTVTTTTTTAATTVKKTTTTKKATTTTTKPVIDVSGPEYEGYRFARDAVARIENKQHFAVSIHTFSDFYREGEYVPFSDYRMSGRFSPGSPLSVSRNMDLYCEGDVGNIGTLFMCQHEKDVYYSYIDGEDEKGRNIWVKNRFSSNGLTENFALMEAAVAELRYLPSAEKAANVEVVSDTKYGKGYFSVTIPVSGAEFAQTYKNSIRQYAFVLLEPDNTLQYSVHDCSVKYGITEEGYLYDTVLQYYLEVTGTREGKPYRETIKVYTDVRLLNYNTDDKPDEEPPGGIQHGCGAGSAPIAQYKEVDNPGFLYYSTLPDS